MRGEILYQKVVITNREEEINDILADGSFRIQSVTPIVMSGEISVKNEKDEYETTNGVLSGGALCFVLAKVEGMEYKKND